MKKRGLKVIRNYLEVIDIFKQPQVIPFLKSNEKEKGSILGGTLTVFTVIGFSVYLFVLSSFFFEPHGSDNYSVLQNAQDINKLLNRTLDETKMGYGLFLKSIKSEKYHDVLIEPKKLEKYVRFIQK